MLGKIENDWRKRLRTNKEDDFEKEKVEGTT
jgi:hypothetical protein